MKEDAQTTEILAALAKGDSQAMDKLLPRVLEDLRTLARKQFASERRDHTLQPTAVANEAFMKLVGQQNVDWKSRAHFFAMASVIIRRILVDHARKRKSRELSEKAWLVSVALETEDKTLPGTIGVEALDAALTELALLDERQAKVVELRYFGGLTVEETAEVLHVSPRTIKGDWRAAKAWLGMRLRKTAGT